MQTPSIINKHITYYRINDDNNIENVQKTQISLIDGNILNEIQNMN